MNTDVIYLPQMEKWRSAGHVSRLGDNRWTKRITEWLKYKTQERVTKKKMKNKVVRLRKIN